MSDLSVIALVSASLYAGWLFSKHEIGFTWLVGSAFLCGVTLAVIDRAF